MAGQRFGRLLVVGEAERASFGGIMWLCRCDCGAQKVVYGGDLRSGKTKSCGCLKREAVPPMTLSHGQSHTTLYRRWASMVQRTTNPNHPAYHNYGGRGITVHPEWRESYEAFARDVADGFSPELELDRIDNDGDYEPGNVRWTTRIEQCRNTRKNRFLTFRGRTKTVAEWCELLGLNFATVTQRLDRSGWSIERALTTGANPDALSRLNEANDAS